MQNIFRVIKKKRNLRRLSGAWFLFLVVLELFSHAGIGQEAFAAALYSMVVETSISSKSDSGQAEMTQGILTDQNQHGQQTICQDEASHHHVLITGFSYPLNTISFRSERIAFHRGEPVTNSLPPPYHPPKLSKLTPINPKCARFPLFKKREIPSV